MDIHIKVFAMISLWLINRTGKDVAIENSSG